MLIVFVDLHPAVWEFCRQLNCRLIFKTYPIDRSISISLLIYRPSEEASCWKNDRPTD